MLVDTHFPGRIALQPETDWEHSVLGEVQDAVSTSPRGGDGGDLLTYWTADVPDYPALDAALQEDADGWWDTGYRALLVIDRATEQRQPPSLGLAGYDYRGCPGFEP